MEARRLAQVLREVGGAGAAVDTGWMACDIPGSWANFAAGLGLKGPVSEGAFDTLIAFYDAHQRPCRVQVTPYQHPSLEKGLEARGFRIVDREVVMVHPLTSLPSQPPPEGLEIRPLEPSDVRDIEAFCDAQGRAFYPEDGLPSGMRPISVRVATHSRSKLWLLTHEGELVGSGGLEGFEGGCVLFGGGVTPEARRMGIHSAFIAHRVAAAKAMGFGYATIASIPGGPTERNARRAGFSPSYTEQTWERTPRRA